MSWEYKFLSYVKRAERYLYKKILEIKTRIQNAIIKILGVFQQVTL